MEFEYITERLKNLPTRGKPPVFFMHIPKTGGTSVDYALKKKYKFNFTKIYGTDSLKAARKVFGDQFVDFDQCYLLRQNVAAYEMERGTKCITGHVPFNRNLMDKDGNGYLWVTMLREPVDRFLSKYFYNYHKKGQHCKFDLPLSEYIHTEDAKASGREYVRFFCGETLTGGESIQRLVEKSKENLAEFDVIGILEDIHRFTTDFRKKTNIQLNIPHKNKTSDLTKDQEVDKAILEQIKKICEFDIELYKYARENFH